MFLCPIQSQRQGRKVEKPSDNAAAGLRVTSPDSSARKRLQQQRDTTESSAADRLSVELDNYLSETAPAGVRTDDFSPNRQRSNSSLNKFQLEDDEEENTSSFYGCRFKTICGIKIDTMVRMLKVCSAFPFVIVVSALNFSNKYAFLR